MRTGEIQAHLPTLCALPDAPARLPDLIAAKAAAEHGAADPALRPTAEAETARLHTVLDEAEAASALPEAPSGRAALHDLVVRARLAG